MPYADGGRAPGPTLLEKLLLDELREDTDGVRDDVDELNDGFRGAVRELFMECFICGKSAMVRPLIDSSRNSHFPAVNPIEPWAMTCDLSLDSLRMTFHGTSTGVASIPRQHSFNPGHRNLRGVHCPNIWYDSPVDSRQSFSETDTEVCIDLRPKFSETTRCTRSPINPQSGGGPSNGPFILFRIKVFRL